MDVEDYLEPEIAVTAAVAALIFSPQARKVLRRGAVYGLAGVMKVGDTISSFAQSVGQGFQETGSMTQKAEQQTPSESHEGMGG